jgi:hypothetical protein
MTTSSVETGSVTLTKQLLFLFVAAWFVAAAGASALGVFDTGDRPPIGLGAFVLLPALGLVSAWRFSPLVRAAARSIPLWKVTAVHALRLLGTSFVVGAVVGKLPGLFGYVAGIGDVVAALTAIPLAVALAKGQPGLRTRFAVWNAFGLIDLVVAITLGILHSPTAFGVLHGSVSTASFGHLPASLVPTFGVPAYVVLHLLAWNRMREV